MPSFTVLPLETPCLGGSLKDTTVYKTPEKVAMTFGFFEKSATEVANCSFINNYILCTAKLLHYKNPWGVPKLSEVVVRSILRIHKNTVSNTVQRKKYCNDLSLCCTPNFLN